MGPRGLRAKVSQHGEKVVQRRAELGELRREKVVIRPGNGKTQGRSQGKTDRSKDSRGHERIRKERENLKGGKVKSCKLDFWDRDA